MYFLFHGFFNHLLRVDLIFEIQEVKNVVFDFRVQQFVHVDFLHFTVAFSLKPQVIPGHVVATLTEIFWLVG